MEITVTAEENEEEGKVEKKAEGKAEKEEEKNAENRGQLCIPKMMQRWMFHDAYECPAVGHQGADQLYLLMKDQYL